jgi:RNA polymerase sigma factor (sigma-70 family)
MSTIPGVKLDKPPAAWTDTRLVRECLNGKEEAWSALVDKYKNLIFSIPIKYGLSRDDAADIFQAVCLEAIAELPRLREPRALPKWLMQVAAHKTFHWKRKQGRLVELEEGEEPPTTGELPPGTEEILHQAEQEQQLRQAIAELPSRCQELVQMLFFEQSTPSYEEIGRSLGVATGSIGFIRGRCLKKLRARLEAMGFK